MVKDAIKLRILREGRERWASGGSVVKNPPAHAGDVGSIPAGKSPMQWSN